MIIIGIDPSLTSTGLCVMDEKGEILETLAINSKFDGAKRLHDIKRQLKPRCCYTSGDSEEKTFVFIEGYSYGSMNGREILGELGGMIRLMLYEEEIEFVDIPPTSLKKFTAGKGNADKIAMAIAVLKIWGKDFPTTDQTDAFALAELGRAYLGLIPGKLPVFKQEVIDGIKIPKVKKKRVARKQLGNV